MNVDVRLSLEAGLIIEITNEDYNSKFCKMFLDDNVELQKINKWKSL